MKVGDYVRTIEGYICKILEIHEEYDDEYLDWNDIHSASIRKSHIIKSSPNIIDLIEVGDYVNGKLVEWIGYDYYKEQEDGKLEGIGEKRVLFNSFTKDSVRQNNIKSIVTKEQFESMEYKIGE